jgi:enamine deaminase RidA (YjgF/YER057c/UK114 family)
LTPPDRPCGTIDRSTADRLHNESSGETYVRRRLISSGSTFEAEIGYSRAVVDGDWVFVSGTTGFDYSTMTIAEGVAEQTEQCLRNIENALAEAGATLADVVRVTYVVPKADEFRECWPVLRRYFGEIRPAAMMISAGLADPRMRIEIEVTARIGSGVRASSRD